MILLLGKRWAGRAGAAGAILAASMAVVSPARAVDDLPVVNDIRIPIPRVLEDDGIPPPPLGYYDRPYSQQPVYRPGPYGQGPYAAIPSARYTRPGLDSRPVIPPVQVVAVLRSSGYSPLGQITQRGWIYTVAALDPDGEDGRLIIDARTGRIMRFIPAMEVDARLSDRMAMAYGPPGPPPVIGAGYEIRRGSLLDLGRSPRPPASVPHTAQRPSSRSAGRVPQSSAASARQQPVTSAQQAAGPSADPSAGAKSAQAVTVIEKKPAVTVGAATASASQTSLQAPPTLHLWPTQAMPDVQTLE
ncbi:hypothetical protein BH10PSE10_BH10PSE10_17760 [soil metagenome]